MKDRHWLRNFVTTCGVVGALLCGSEGRAELKPGDVLDKAT
jgi:hypothetical protein